MTREAHNEKWLTDVTVFKWYEGIEAHKLYLSAILGLYDRRIVSYVLSQHNDNPLVFKIFDKAVQANPDGNPLCSTVTEDSPVHQPCISPQACAGGHDAEYIPRSSLH